MTTIPHASGRRAATSRVKGDRGQIAAAKLIMKRNEEGKGSVEITERIRDLAAIKNS